MCATELHVIDLSVTYTEKYKCDVNNYVEIQITLHLIQ